MVRQWLPRLWMHGCANACYKRLFTGKGLIRPHIIKRAFSTNPQQPRFGEWAPNAPRGLPEMITTNICTNISIGEAFDSTSNLCEVMKKAVQNSDLDRLYGIYSKIEWNSSMPADLCLQYCKIVLSGYTKLSQMEAAKEFFDRMIDRGIRPDNSVFRILLRGYLRYSELEAANDLLGVMPNYDLSISALEYNELIVYFLDIQKDLPAAKKTLADMRNSDCVPNLATFMAFWRYFIEISDFQSAAQIRSMLSSERIQISISAYTEMLTFYFRKMMLKEVDSILAEMRGLVWNQKTFNAVVAGFASCNKFDRVKLALEDMRNAGIDPNAATYNGILEHVASTGNSEQTKQLLVEMSERGLAFNSTSFTALFKGMIQKGQFVDAIALLLQMSESRVCLTIESFGELIEKSCENNFEAAVRLLSRYMAKQGLRPNLPIFSMLIKYNLRRRRYSVVDSLLVHLRGHRIVPNGQFFSQLLNHYIEILDIQRIRDTLKLMSDLGLEPNNYTYDILMKALFVVCRYSEGGLIFRCIGSNLLSDPPKVVYDRNRMNISTLKNDFEKLFGIPFRLTIHVYNELLLSFFRLRRFDEFFEVVRGLKSNDLGIRPNVLTYTLIIKSRIGLAAPPLAEDALLEMYKFGLKPTVFQCALIFHSYCRLLETSRAEAFLETILGLYKIAPNHIFYASLIFAYIRKADYASVFRIYDQIERVGFIPDTETCNYVLTALFAINENNEALRFFEKMVNQNVRRNNYTYNILADRLLDRNEPEKLLKLYEDCLIPGNSIQPFPFARLLNYYFQAGQLSRIPEIIQIMIDYQIPFSDAILPYVVHAFNQNIEDPLRLAESQDIVLKSTIDFEFNSPSVLKMIQRLREELEKQGDESLLVLLNEHLETSQDLKPKYRDAPDGVIESYRAAYEEMRMEKFEFSTEEVKNPEILLEPSS